MDEKNKIESGLYIVPTPIGNLEDITLRAIKVLTEVDIIACEDTRRTGQLLKVLDIKAKQLTSYHEHNEKEKADYLALQILSGKSAAIVSDAGTPGISDPAYRVIKSCIERDIQIVPLPGASALLPALLGSGFGSDSFVFLGFPPHKKGRKTFVDKMMQQQHTAIVYESPFRIAKLIDMMAEMGYGNRQICIARELTKLHEEFIRATVDECVSIIANHKNMKGEFVLVIAPV